MLYVLITHGGKNINLRLQIWKCFKYLGTSIEIKLGIQVEVKEKDTNPKVALAF